MGDKVTYQEELPAPGGPRPSRLSPSEAYFAQRLDRRLFEKERQETKERVLKTMGTHRKKRMEAKCDSFSCLARGREDGKPAWGENNSEKLAKARINFYATTSPRTIWNTGKKFNTVKESLPVLEYFSEYEPYKPGDPLTRQACSHTSSSQSERPVWSVTSLSGTSKAPLIGRRLELAT